MKNWNLVSYLMGVAGLGISAYVVSMAWKKGQEKE